MNKKQQRNILALLLYISFFIMGLGCTYLGIKEAIIGKDDSLIIFLMLGIIFLLCSIFFFINSLITYKIQKEENLLYTKEYYEKTQKNEESKENKREKTINVFWGIFFVLVPYSILAINAEKINPIVIIKNIFTSTPDIATIILVIFIAIGVYILKITLTTTKEYQRNLQSKQTEEIGEIRENIKKYKKSKQEPTVRGITEIIYEIFNIFILVIIFKIFWQLIFSENEILKFLSILILIYTVIYILIALLKILKGINTYKGGISNKEYEFEEKNSKIETIISNIRMNTRKVAVILSIIIISIIIINK